MFLTMVHVATPAWDTLREDVDSLGPEWSTAGGWWLPAGFEHNRMTVNRAYERERMVYWEESNDCFEA